MSLFPIFKVIQLADKDTVDTIYVFYGTNVAKIKEIQKLWDNNPYDKTVFTKEEVDNITKNKTDVIFSSQSYDKTFVTPVFTKEEVDNITKNKTNVIFLAQTIHTDDSIGVIKLKIFDAIGKQYSMNELYLFCLKSEKLNPITVYQSLTQNDKLPLTKVRLNQLILNLYDAGGKQINFGLTDKATYTFDDILKLDLVDRNYLVAKPLGQKFIFENEYPFIANPFLVYEYDNLLERSRKELTSLSGNLLLETGQIFSNNIYLCIAQKVFELSKKNDISKLIQSTSEKFTEDIERNFKNINMFYNVFTYNRESKKFSENVKLSGINYIKAIIYPEFKIKIPIDVIFKLVHATKELPLIKYNPQTRQENIYRLFAPQLSVDGNKIPFLQKSVIFKLMKTIGKNQSVAVYTNVEYKGIKYYMTCEFEDNGNITIYPIVDFETPISLSNSSNKFDDIDNIIGLAVNPIIEQIQPFFLKSGLEIPLFKSIQSLSVEVRDIRVQTVYNITKEFDVNKYSGCLSSIFTIESSNFKKGIEMRYKRVSNFNKRDSQDAFIIEKIDQGHSHDEIIEDLLKNFMELDAEQANDLIIKIRSELEVTRGSNKRRALMIKINPGFKTVMTVDPINSYITINVSGINDIYYLNTIPVYINTFIRITQDIKSTSISSSVINNLCSRI